MYDDVIFWIVLVHHLSKMAFNDISLLPDLLDALNKQKKRKGLIVPLCNTVFKLLKKEKKKLCFLKFS